jgi:hypothetical protein
MAEQVDNLMLEHLKRFEPSLDRPDRIERRLELAD